MRGRKRLRKKLDRARRRWYFATPTLSHEMLVHDDLRSFWSAVIDGYFPGALDLIPPVASKQVARAVELIARVYRWHPCGGGLHIVTDDGNCDREQHIAWCRNNIRDKPVADDYPQEQKDAELACAEFLLTLTEDEVREARDRFWKTYPFAIVP